jgi:DUF1680 family protein
VTITKYFQVSLILAAALSVQAVRGGNHETHPGAVVADVESCLPPGQIRMGGELGRRMDDCMTNLITAWDLERIIKPFRDKTDGRDNHWRCDYWGKWFTALAWGYAHQPTPEHRRLLDRAAKELMATQGADGNIGSFEGKLRLNGSYDVWGRQCVILGLVAYFDLTGDRSALDAACRELDCLMGELQQKKARLVDLGGEEWNGLPPSVAIESGALLYQRTGLKKYRDFSEQIAAQWNEPGKLAPKGLRLVKDALAGKPAREIGSPKAYEQMYCFIGICELYRATGERKYLDAAVALAKNIRAEELFITGASSEKELWFKGRSQQTRVVSAPAETCVTAHWMYFCWHLLRLTGDPAYADEMERSLYNALLGALMPDGHWWAYYSSLMGYRVASPPSIADIGLSCCVVSGSRGLMLTPFWAVMQTGEGPVLNLYFPGTAEAKTASGGKVLLEMETDYPRLGAVRLTVKPARPENFTLSLRIPAWSQQTTLKVNGEAVAVQPGTYAKIRRQWAQNDQVQLNLDMRARAVDAPDGSGQVAVQRGPIVLCLDDRLTPPEKDAAAVIKRDSSAHVDIQPNADAANRIGAWMAFDVPFVVGGNARTLTMCDYASAGNRWSEGNQYRTWLPQPLRLETAYQSGMTWKTLFPWPQITSKPEAPASPRHSPAAAAGKLKADRIVFLGNSITLHGPSDAVQWAGNWGMAASEEQKDYVHLVASALAKRTGKMPALMVANIADFERGHATYDLEANLKKFFDFQPDIVVVAIGENVPALSSKPSQTAYQTAFLKLLEALQRHGRPAIFVRSCFWADPTKDAIMRECSAAAGVRFVDVGSLGRDAANAARDERYFPHGGVAGHPGDQGMQALADALLRAILVQP